jgi:hypothetical protein
VTDDTIHRFGPAAALCTLLCVVSHSAMAAAPVDRAAPWQSGREAGNANTAGDHPLEPLQLANTRPCQVSTQAGTQSERFKLAPGDFENLSHAIDAYTYDLRMGVDGYTATDDLWEWLIAIFGEEHAWKTRDAFFGSCAVHALFRVEFEYLFVWEGALAHIVWTEIDEI